MKVVPPAVIDDLSARFGAAKASLTFLGGGQDWSDGTLYRFTPGGAVGSPGGARVIKFLSFPESDREAVLRAEDRVRFVKYFAKHLGREDLGVMEPLPSVHGSLFETVVEGGQLHLAYAYPFVPGRMAKATDVSVKSGALFAAIGRTLGAMHAAWEAFPETLTPAGGSDASAALKGWRDEWAFFRGWCRDDEVGLAWERLRGALESLPVHKASYGFTHNDAHVWNFVGQDEGEAGVLIDFDVSNWHFFGVDSANALYSFLILGSGGIETGSSQVAGLPRADYEEWAFGKFWDGYRRHRDPGKDAQENLPLFLQYRRCLLFMPFQEQTAKKPSWRARWKRAIAEADARLFG